MKNICIFAGLLLFLAVRSTGAWAFSWEGAVITCGDHQFGATIEVSWPESLMTFSGASTPRWRSLPVSTLVVKDFVDGQPTMDFYFQALNGIDVELTIRSMDGRRGIGLLTWENGDQQSFDCRVEMPIVM